MMLIVVFFLMIRRPPRSTRTDTLLSLHDALPISVLTARILGALVCNINLAAANIALPDVGVAFGATQTALNIVGESDRSEEHTSELQSLMRISYAVFCLKKKK